MKTFKIWFIFSIIFIISVIPLNATYACEENNVREHNIYTMDDEYVYRLSEDGIEIIKINNYEDMYFDYRLDEYKMKNSKIYVYNNRLFISGIENDEDKSYIKICVYDIYDKKNPIKINDFKLEGYEYLFKHDDNGSIYLVIQQTESNIQIVSIDLNKTEVDLNIDCFEGGEINFIYLSENDLYVICNDDMIDRYFTTIHKFNINRSEFKYINKISFDGIIYNDKFIHKYDGNLRVLATCENSKNKVYILDRDFTYVNFIDVILDNKNINSVYFDGELCYISGFLKDGYFSIYNLNYSNPNYMGSIKLTSSFNYIYKLSDDKFVVVGNEHRADTYKNMQSDKVFEVIKNTGIKINLIDVSDKNSPKIFDEYFIKGKEAYLSEFLDEGKMLFSKDKNLLAFTLDMGDNSIDMDINTAMEVNSDILIPNCDKLFTGVYVFDLDDKEGIGLKFIIESNDNLFKDKSIEGISIHKDSIFIFSDDYFEVFDLDGKLLGEYTFKKEETR